MNDYIDIVVSEIILNGNLIAKIKFTATGSKELVALTKSLDDVSTDKSASSGKKNSHAYRPPGAFPAILCIVSII